MHAYTINIHKITLKYAQNGAFTNGRGDRGTVNHKYLFSQLLKYQLTQKV